MISHDLAIVIHHDGASLPTTEPLSASNRFELASLHGHGKSGEHPLRDKCLFGPVLPVHVVLTRDFVTAVHRPATGETPGSDPRVGGLFVSFFVAPRPRSVRGGEPERGVLTTAGIGNVSAELGVLPLSTVASGAEDLDGAVDAAARDQGS